MPLIRQPRAAALAVVCAGALAVAGCGGSSSSTSSNAGATSTSASVSAGVTATNGSPGASASASGPTASGSKSGRQPATTLPPDARKFLVSLLPYAQSWQNASQSFGASVKSAGNSLGKLASASGTYAKQTQDFANGVASLHAPAGASSQQKALVASIRRLDGDVTALQSAAAHGNASQAQAAERNARNDSGAVSTDVLKLARALAGGALAG